MLQIGIQTKNIIDDTYPQEGFELLKKVGFHCVDFSLDAYLVSKDLYPLNGRDFFAKSIEELKEYFTPHKQAAKKVGIKINQMHMSSPVFVPTRKREINEYLWYEVAEKSMHICKFLECPYIVIHGFKMAKFLGSEEAEWQETEKFIDFLAPMAKEMGITICIENIHDNFGEHLMEGSCCDARKAVERIDRINEKYQAEVLGYCFDTGHANLVGVDFEDFLSRLGHRLKVLHIHDNDGVRDLHQIPFAYTRTRDNQPSTDWDGFIKGLQKSQFDGVLSFEAAPVFESFPKEMKEDTMWFMARIGKYFISKVLG